MDEVAPANTGSTCAEDNNIVSTKICWMKDVVGVELVGGGGNDMDGKEMIIFFGDEVLSWTPRILLSSLVGGEE